MNHNSTVHLAKNNLNYFFLSAARDVQRTWFRLEAESQKLKAMIDKHEESRSNQPETPTSSKKGTNKTNKFLGYSLQVPSTEQSELTVMRHKEMNRFVKKSESRQMKLSHLINTAFCQELGSYVMPKLNHHFFTSSTEKYKKMKEYMNQLQKSQVSEASFLQSLPIIAVPFKIQKSTEGSEENNITLHNLEGDHAFTGVYPSFNGITQEDVLRMLEKVETEDKTRAADGDDSDIDEVSSLSDNDNHESRKVQPEPLTDFNDKNIYLVFVDGLHRVGAGKDKSISKEVIDGMKYTLQLYILNDDINTNEDVQEFKQTMQNYSLALSELHLKSSGHSHLDLFFDILKDQENIILDKKMDRMNYFSKAVNDLKNDMGIIFCEFWKTLFDHTKKSTSIRENDSTVRSNKHGDIPDDIIYDETSLLSHAKKETSTSALREGSNSIKETNLSISHHKFLRLITNAVFYEKQRKIQFKTLQDIKKLKMNLSDETLGKSAVCKK